MVTGQLNNHQPTTSLLLLAEDGPGVSGVSFVCVGGGVGGGGWGDSGWMLRIKLHTINKCKYYDIKYFYKRSL